MEQKTSADAAKKSPGAAPLAIRGIFKFVEPAADEPDFRASRSEAGFSKCAILKPKPGENNKYDQVGGDMKGKLAEK